MKNKKLIPLISLTLLTTISIAYTDITPTHWCYEKIMEYTNKNYVTGYEDSTFRPSSYVTRAEFVQIINNVFGFTDSTTCTFTDVPKNAWYKEQIAIAQNIGYINGYEDNTFRPNEPITRQEAFVIIANILKLDSNTEDEGLTRFKDADEVKAWAYEIIDNYVKYDMVSGYLDGTVKPSGNITRAETISLLSSTQDVVQSESVKKHINGHIPKSDETNDENIEKVEETENTTEQEEELKEGINKEAEEQEEIINTDEKEELGKTSSEKENTSTSSSSTSLAVKYTVTFKDDDGTVLQTEKLKKGKFPVYNGEEPQKEDTARYTYEFAGWEPEITKVTGSITYTATYTATSLVTLPVNVNAPVLGVGMKAVCWDDDDATVEIEADEFTEGMYDYVKGDNVTDTKDSKWANAKTEDGSYWVWIPRYAYKITYYTDETKETVSDEKTSYGDIDVLFMNGTSNTQYLDAEGEPQDLPEGYIVHPAFQAMTETDVTNLNPQGKWDEELTGIWVAKYEMSKETSTDDGETWVAATTSNASSGNVLTTTAGNASETQVRVVSKPSVTSWRYISDNYVYQNTLAINEDLNSHLMKNSEWGAVAYLTYSAYGRNGNELAVNQCSNYYTGAGPGTGASSVYTSTYAYDAGTFASTYAWNTAQGKLASTTGNIYGVYDTSGGVYEYVASFVNNGNAALTNASKGGVLGTVPANATAEDLKTRQVYPMGVTDTQQNNYNAWNNIKGDAVYETSTSHTSSNSWCGDYSCAPFTTVPFFVRGGVFGDTSGAGVFCFYYSTGGARVNYGFRGALAIPPI